MDEPKIQGLWIHGQDTRAPSTPMPEMEWPPPRWTAHHEVGAVAEDKPIQLKAPFLRVKAMLERADLVDARVFAIGEDGFAVVTRMESIADDGTPAKGGRFGFDATGRMPPRFSLGYYLDALFNRKPGRYRMFVLVVTPRVVSASEARAGFGEAMSRYNQGAAHLPAALAEKPVSAGTHMTILVYEFKRPTADDERPVSVENSAITAKQHIVGAGLLAPEAFGR